MVRSKMSHTDENYLSKEEVDLTKNLLWNDVQKYRSIYTYEIPLLCDVNSHARLVQTPWILQKEIKATAKYLYIYEKVLISVSTKYTSSTILDDVTVKANSVDVKWIAKSKNIQSSVTHVEDLMTNYSTSKNEEDKEIISLIEKLDDVREEITTPIKISKKFYGIEISNPNKNIPIHDSMMETIIDPNIGSGITKISSMMYSLISNEMFGKKTYEVMIIMAISMTANSNFTTMMCSISKFETLAKFKEKILKAIENAKNDDGDLTYLTLVMIDFFIFASETSSQNIINFIENETRYNSVSLRDRNANIKIIEKEHPDLSKKQILFYVQNSNNLFFYSVKDFQNQFGTSYETARYSMEKLVKKGFYKKEKVGKKYVYKSIKQ